MASAFFDTLTISNRLREAGASEPLAQAMAHSFAEANAAARLDLATKGDLTVLKSELLTQIAQVEAKVESSQRQVIVWMGGMLLAAVGLAVTLINALR